MSADYARPPGLPAHALTLGVDRTLDACQRRWWFRKGEGLRPREEARALSFGTAWHAVLDDVHLWWARRNGAEYPAGEVFCSWCDGTGLGGVCARCNGTGAHVVHRIASGWVGTDREDDGETLRRALRGWFHVYGRVPPPGWRVLAVEQAIAMPIPSADSASGATYAPELCWVTGPDGRTRLARTGEALDGALPPGWRAEWIRTPAWLSLRLDVLWWDPRSAIYVQEHKSSGDPRRYLAGLAYDPQVTLYELATEYALKAGQIPSRPSVVGGVLELHPPGTPWVAGWLYDVTSSKRQSDPTPLKRGGFSVARNLLGSVPTWRLRDALTAAGIPFTDPAVPPPKPKKGADPDEPVESDPRTWEDVIIGQADVDAKLYIREFGRSGPDERQRALRESYAAARRAAALHRAAATTAPGSGDLDVHFPRTSICRQAGAFCAFRGPCVQDGPDARQYFTVSDAPDWGPVPGEIGDEEA